MSELQSYLGWKIDFRNPPGEPSGLGPDSMHWRVYKNPVAMAVGGVAAVLLEFADARALRRWLASMGRLALPSG
ncbi:MAG: hypothetical protein ABMA14_20185 [Hyphomonadaceae bacterium]